MDGAGRDTFRVGGTHCHLQAFLDHRLSPGAFEEDSRLSRGRGMAVSLDMIERWRSEAKQTAAARVQRRTGS